LLRNRSSSDDHRLAALGCGRLGLWKAPLPWRGSIGSTNRSTSDRQRCHQHGLPKTIRVDQGSQFTSKEFDLWTYANGSTLDFSRPSKPDNAYVESFNATVRLECLGQHWFLDLDETREKVEERRIEYNDVRPHSAIGDRTPLSLIHRPRHDAEGSKTPEILT
jgi:putative transposase